MASYLINKKHRDESIVSIDDFDGYIFRPKKSDTYLSVNKVKIIDKDMIDKILTIKFEKKFRKVVALAMTVLEDEDSSEDAVGVVLDEVELVREILLNKYQKFLNSEKEKLFLKKLRLIENEMRMKEIQIVAKYRILEEEKTKGRGR